MLDQFVTVNREEIIRRCRAKGVTRLDPPTTRGEIDHGVPMFLDQLLGELRHGQSQNVDITRSATQHGNDLRRQGFTVSQVVHGYGDVCQSITEMAVERHAPISTNDFRTLNRCLDDAIAGAVTEYGRERDDSGERATTLESARLVNVARDVLKSIQISKVALDVIRSGTVGINGSTGKILGLGLDTANDLTERLLATLAKSSAQPVSSPAGSKDALQNTK